MLLSAGPRTCSRGCRTVRDVNDKYKAATAADMPNSAVIGYMEQMIAYQALEKAASAKGPDIAKALHAVKLTHDQGNLWPQDTMSFDATGALARARPSSSRSRTARRSGLPGGPGQRRAAAVPLIEVSGARGLPGTAHPARQPIVQAPAYRIQEGEPPCSSSSWSSSGCCPAPY